MRLIFCSAMPGRPGRSALSGVAAALAWLCVAPTHAYEPAANTSHYYAWHRGNAYGYELEQTEFSREHTATPPSISYWYEGRKDGVYHLRQFNGPYIDMIRCTAPCTTVRIINAQVDKMLPLRPGTALWGAVQDMLAGKLTPAK